MSDFDQKNQKVSEQFNAGRDINVSVSPDAAKNTPTLGIEVVEGTLTTMLLTATGEEGQQRWDLYLKFFADLDSDRPLTIPFHRCKLAFEISGYGTYTEFLNIVLRPFGESDPKGHQVTITQPSMLELKATTITKPYGGTPDSPGRITGHLSFSPSHGTVHLELSLVTVRHGFDEWAKWIVSPLEQNTIRTYQGRNMQHRIVIVDDETVATQFYIRALELDGIAVEHYSSVNSFKAFLAFKKPATVDMFIVDVMMPPAPGDEKISEEGMLTGLFLARDIRRAYTDVPIIIFSHYNFNGLQKAAKRLSDNLSACIFVEKIDVPPSELVDMVNRYFQESKLEPNRKFKVIERLFGSLLLQPNIGGVGIDLKRLKSHED